MKRSSDANEWYRAWQASSDEGVLVHSLAGRVLDISARAAAILGIDGRAAVGRTVADLGIRLRDDVGAALSVASVLGVDPTMPGARTGPVLVTVNARPDGVPTQRTVRVSSRLVAAARSAQPEVLTTLLDVTERCALEAALTRSELQFRVAMENAPIGMALVGLDWHVIEVNPSFAELLGTAVEELRGADLGAFLRSDDREVERAQLADLLDGREQRFTHQMKYERADGTFVWVMLDVVLICTPTGEPDHFVAQARDTTEAKLHSELLAHRAMHDPLTGLANRTLLQEVLQLALEHPGGAGHVAVLACDLDGFKPINDRFGHAAGDEVLVHVAGVLRAAAAGRGAVARVGGDEFVVVIHDPDSARAVFEVASGIHARLREPVWIQRSRVPVRVSIGIALAGPETLTLGAPSLLAAADAALYRAKADGRGRTEVYEPSMSVSGSSGLRSEVAGALDANELVLYYQPIVDLTTAAVVGHEAVLRWQHPELGLLLPAAFGAAVAESGLMVPIGLRMVEEAVAHLSRGPADRWVSVNAVAEQLGDGEFAARLLDVVARRRVAPGRLVVELTESSLAGSGMRIRHDLVLLREAGIPLLLDDFATGMSSLGLLRDLPVNGIKLGLSFTAGILDDPAAAKVGRALGAMARELDLITVAEGIESDEQADLLWDSGWRYGQGWLFGGVQPESATG